MFFFYHFFLPILLLRGYWEALARQDGEKDENVTIPIDFDFAQLSSLSNELKEKLILTKPRNIGQALRIEGMSPAAVNLILSMIKSKAKSKKIA